MGIVYAEQGQYPEALDYYQKALALRREVGARDGEGLTLTAIGVLYDDRAQYPEALAAHQQALAIFEEIGDRSSKGSTLNNISTVYTHLAQYQKAIISCQQALRIALEIGDQAGAATRFNNLGEVYTHVGKFQQALDNYQQALPLQRKIGDQGGAAGTLYNMGAVYDELGSFKDALDYYRQALEIFKSIHKQAEQGTVLTAIGAIYGHAKSYEQALSNYQQAQIIAEKIGDQVGETRVINNIGFTYAVQKNYGSALETFQHAWKIAHDIGNREGEGVILSSIGYVYELQGNRTQAISQYQQAVDTIESIQKDLKVGELEASFAGEQILVYEHLVHVLEQENQPTKAFEYVERARAKAFLDQLGNQRINFRQGADSDLLEKEQALRQQIIDAQQALQNERAKPADQQDQALLNTASAKLEQARHAYEELIVQLKLADPKYASFVSVDTLSLAQVQQVIDPQTTLIEYFVMDNEVLAWVIEREGFALVHLDIKRKDLTAQITNLNNLIIAIDTMKKQGSDANTVEDLIATTAEISTTAANLYKTLFATLKPHIHTQNLIIVPQAMLHRLPFAALLDMQTHHYLVQDYALTYAPSASILRLIEHKPNANKGQLLAMGNPDRSLPNAETEVAAVASLYGTKALVRSQATESQVYIQAAQIGILHLAAHGVYDPYNPLYTRIELAADQTNDGNLEVHEIFGLNLKQANLVVLSACDTSNGEVTNGDEIVGLTRAFLYAGAPAVITTLWSIDDAASGVLMASFYQHLRAGMTNAEALRAAQVELLKQAQWNSPYYWAAFNLTGDYLGNNSPNQ